MLPVFTQSRKKQTGMTLLEVLIALLVISVGLLGMAGLQLTGMKMTNDAYFRSQATWLAYDMFDRMRANLNQASNTNNYKIFYSDSAPSATNCASTACTPAQMATYDLAAWKNALAAKLPAGNGEISYANTGTGRTYVIAIQWDDSRGEDSLKTLQIRTGL